MAGETPHPAEKPYPAEISWEVAAAAVTRYARAGSRAADVAQLIKQIAAPFAAGPLHTEHFATFESNGFHITPAYFYSPIPDCRALGDEVFAAESAMVGIDMREAEQVRLVRDVFPRFKTEYSRFRQERNPDAPHDFYYQNPQFSGTDATILYCMVRHLRPRLVIEVGCGYSTRVTAAAAVANGGTRVVCIEPYATEPQRHEVFASGFPGLSELIRKKVEDVPLSTFEQFSPGDILFIDTSHVTKIGGDVNYLFLEVIPRLPPGAVVHVHDVFLPHNYPRSWVMERRQFFNEQYLLQAFLAFNTNFEILMANAFMGLRHWNLLRDTFPDAPWWGGGSLWMRRRR